MFIFGYFIYLLVYLFTCLMNLYLFCYLPVSLFVRVSFYLSVYLFPCLLIFILCLPFRLFVHLFAH